MKIAFFLLLLVPLAHAEIYKWVDEKGVIHYSDEKPEGQQVLQQEIEIKNEQLQFMHEKDEALLESFDAERAEQKKQDLQQQTQTTEQDKINDRGSVLDAYFCFEPSPANTPTGISYLEINPRELTGGQIDMLEEIFGYIEGDWRGRAEGFECFGTEDKPEKRKQTYQAQADATIGVSSALRLVVDLNLRDQGVHQQDSYLFYLEDKKLRLGSPGKAGDVELSHLTEKGFRIYQKQWQGRHGSVRTFVESLTQISLDGDRLYFERFNFYQGVLGDMKIMELQKF